MTDTTETKSPASDAGFALKFDLDRPETFTLTGKDKAFTEAEEDDVRACYAGKPFSLEVRRLTSKQIDRLRKRRTKTKVQKGAVTTDTDNPSFVEDMFVECVVSWDGFGPKRGNIPLPCNEATKRRIFEKAPNFVNAVVAAAINHGDAVEKDEAAEVERFR